MKITLELDLNEDGTNIREELCIGENRFREISNEILKICLSYAEDMENGSHKIKGLFSKILNIYKDNEAIAAILELHRIGTSPPN
jgi:hypothetical protein